MLLLGQALSQHRHEKILQDATLANDDTADGADVTDAVAIIPSTLTQPRHLSKRSLTFAFFVDNLRFQPQLFTGLGAQLYSVE